MALSNWDTLAFNQDGPCSGTLIGHSDNSSAIIYKNWLYIRDSRMWVEKTSFVNDTIAQINSGDVQLSDFQIYSTRGSQDAIFALIRSKNYSEENPIDRWMAGIGCNGSNYQDRHDMVLEILKINPDDHHDIQVWERSEYNQDIDEWNSTLVIDLFDSQDEVTSSYELALKDYPQLEIQYVGVQPKTYEEFLVFLERAISQNYGYNERMKEWFNKIKSGEFDALRFNQGDKYLDPNNEIGKTTPIGEASKPILNQLFESKEGKNG